MDDGLLLRVRDALSISVDSLDKSGAHTFTVRELLKPVLAELEAWIDSVPDEPFCGRDADRNKRVRNNYKSVMADLLHKAVKGKDDA